MILLLDPVLSPKFFALNTVMGNSPDEGESLKLPFVEHWACSVRVHIVSPKHRLTVDVTEECCRLVRKCATHDNTGVYGINPKPISGALTGNLHHGTLDCLP